MIAIGPALALPGGCALDLLGPAGAPIVRVEGGPPAAAGDLGLCTSPPLLVAADDARATLVGWQGGAPRLLRVDRRGGAVLDAVALEASAAIRHEPHTGLALELIPGGDVQATRFDRAGPVRRRWRRSGVHHLGIRGVPRVDGPPLLLISEGRRWTAVDPITLAERWTITSDAQVVIAGEVTPPGADLRALARAGERHLVDAERGATIARRRLPGGHRALVVGEVAVVEAGGVIAHDLRSGAIRWATPGRIHEVHPGGLVSVIGPGQAWLAVVDAQAGIRRLQVERVASLVARAPADGGDLSVVVIEGTPALAAYADDPAAFERLGDDPIVALAPPCDQARATTLADLDRVRGCHLPQPHALRFAVGDAELPPGGAATLDDLAARWRRAARGEGSGPQGWPRLLVRAHRSSAEDPSLASRRADALREALIARGVACSHILAASDPDPVSTRVDVTWHAPIDCLL